jgi:hypothetical protein
MSVIWSWTYFYNLHWNNYLYFKGLLYIWEEMIMWHWGPGRYIWMWQSKREISRECNDIIGSAKGSQISEKIWGEVGKGKRVDAYLERAFSITHYNAMLFVTSILIGWRLNFHGINSTVDAIGETMQAQT